MRGRRHLDSETGSSVGRTALMASLVAALLAGGVAMVATATTLDLGPKVGDILVFRRSPKGPVSHVGLYLGDGQFIHSATNGVQISRLSADDTYGKWWWQRWAGARRIVAAP